MWTAFELPEDDQSDDEGDEDSFEQDRGTASQSVDFLRIVGEMVSTGHAEGHPADSLLMEIKGCKFAQNKVRDTASSTLFHLTRVGSLLQTALLELCRP